ncbi:MAG TPA: Rho termination factor N-terminal domain-containing protein [Bacillota bacterium]|jgi:hypothetical protein|nr:Rho termination factor N-terminal domain-containing protein [Bacillota bacterium]
MSVTGFNRRRRELEKRKQQERSQAVALDELTFHELRALAKDKEIEGYMTMKKDQLIEALGAVI